jgi:hypothetical protein
MVGISTVITTGTTTTVTPTTAGTTTNAATTADTIRQTARRSTCIFETEAYQRVSSVWRKLHAGDDQVDLPYNQMLEKSEQ